MVTYTKPQQRKKEESEQLTLVELLPLYFDPYFNELRIPKQSVDISWIRISTGGGGNSYPYTTRHNSDVDIHAICRRSAFSELTSRWPNDPTTK